MGRFLLSCFPCETLTKTKKTQSSPHNSVKKMCSFETWDSDEDGIFWGVAEGYFWHTELWVCEVRWDWLEDNIWRHPIRRHLMISFFLLSFLFCFSSSKHEFWSSWAIEERERESWVVWTLLCFWEWGAWSFHVSSFFLIWVSLCFLASV